MNWSLTLANLMIETNNQHLVHHLLASLNQRANIINGNSSPDSSSFSSCHANGSNSSHQMKVPANDAKYNSMHKKDSPISYCDSEGAIKSTSVKSRAFSKSHFDRPNEQTKLHTSSKNISSSTNEKLHTVHHQENTPGHISQARDQLFYSFNNDPFPQNHLNPERLRHQQMDLPDSTLDDSQLIAKSIGSKLRKLAESFHLSLSNVNCIP